MFKNDIAVSRLYVEIGKNCFGKIVTISRYCRKFEEIYPPDVGEFVYITDDTYTKKQVLRMEHLILKVLNFDVAVPTSNQFLKRFLKAAEADSKTEFLSQVI